MRFFNFGGFIPWNGVSQQVAHSVLKDRFISPSDVEPIFGTNDQAIRLPYSNWRVGRSGKDNAAKKHDWLLYPRQGLSLWELKQMFPKEFCSSNVWDEHPGWLDVKGDPGYRLIDLNMMWVGEPLTSRTYNPKWTAPAHLATVAECAITLKLLRNQKFLEKSFHIGEFNRNDDVGVMVPLLGRYDGKGMLLYTLPLICLERFGQPDTGVIVCKVP